ncbi:MAG: YdaU family protein [Methylocella sp.]
MSKPDVWMPFYPGDYLRDTGRFTTLPHGAYLLLLFDYWVNGAPPDNDETLAVITKLAPEQWRAMRKTMAAKFTIAGGFWIHGRVDRERTAATARLATAVEKARLAALVRWENARSNAPSNANGNASGMLEAMPPSNASSQSQPYKASSPSQPSKSKALRRAKAAALTHCPPDFGISDRVKTWAVDKGHRHLEAQFDCFMSYVKRKRPRYADWDEALMTCIREDWAKLTKANGSPGNWWLSEAMTIAKGKEIGISPRPGEDIQAFRGRINAKLENIAGSA